MMVHGTLCVKMASLLMMQLGFVGSMDILVRGYTIICRISYLSPSPSLSLPDGTIVTDSSIVLSNPRPYVNLSCPDYDYYRAGSCYINSNSGLCNYTVVKCFDGKLRISC